MGGLREADWPSRGCWDCVEVEGTVRRPGWWPREDRGSGVLARRRREVFASCWVFSVILGWGGLGSFLPSFCEQQGGMGSEPGALSPFFHRLLISC